jgi:hypothetical protein
MTLPRDVGSSDRRQRRGEGWPRPRTHGLRREVVEGKRDRAPDGGCCPSRTPALSGGRAQRTRERNLGAGGCSSTLKPLACLATIVAFGTHRNLHNDLPGS